MQGKKLTIIGASGHAKVVAEIALLNGYDYLEFLDDDANKQSCFGFPVVGSLDDIKSVKNDIFIAIGDNSLRAKLFSQVENCSMPILIHPKAIVSEKASIGVGAVVMAGAVVNPYAKIGVGCIINTCSSVDHDCCIGDFSHVSVGAHIAGSVIIGKQNFIGAGAIIINNKNICDGNIIGAGAIVVKNLVEHGVYYGVPAKKRHL